MSFHIRLTPIITSLLLTLALSACSAVDKSMPDTTANEELDSRINALTEQEADFQRRMEALEEKERQVQAKLTTMQDSEENTGDDVLPSYAKPGECYTRLWVPPIYKKVTNKILVSEQSERVEVIPSTYKKVSKKVLVKEASSKIITTPATYTTVTERVVIRPASEKTIMVPATYGTVKEKVIDKPAHTEWTKGTGPIQRIDDTTGEIMCLIEIPATYKTVSRRVVKTPATTQIKSVPALYKVINKTVIDKPASSKTVEIPAEYKTIEVMELDKPSEVKRTAIPEKYTEVDTRELVTIGRMEWRSILCETNTTRERIAQIQTALLDTGFDPGPIDGVIGVETMRAVNNYQRSKGLPIDRFLNIETVESLGVSPN